MAILSSNDVKEYLKQEGEEFNNYQNFIVAGTKTIVKVQVIDDKLYLKGIYNLDNDIESIILVDNYLIYHTEEEIILLNIHTFKKTFHRIGFYNLCKISDITFIALVDNNLELYELKGSDIALISNTELKLEDHINIIRKIPDKNQLILFAHDVIYVLNLDYMNKQPDLIYKTEANMSLLFLILDSNTLIFFIYSNLMVLDLTTTKTKVADTELINGINCVYKIDNDHILVNGSDEDEPNTQIWNIRDMKLISKEKSAFINDGYRLNDKLFLEGRLELIQLTKYVIKKHKKIAETVFELTSGEWSDEEFKHILPIPESKLRKKLMNYYLFESCEGKLNDRLIDIIRKFI